MILSWRSRGSLIVMLAVWAAPGLHVRAEEPPSGEPKKPLISAPAILSQRGAGPTPGEANKPWVPDIEIEQYTLDNGLTVVLHEDHKAPLVSVNVSYNVGSKDDPPGLSGFAHVFEHMMFEGSEHSDSTFHFPLYETLIRTQGTTTEDRTVYETTVTSNALERVLWLEADRMGFLLPAVTTEKLHSVLGSVKNERRQSLDELPLGEAHEAVLSALYSPGHPYRHSAYGSMTDLSAARLDDFPAFCRQHYRPDNAFLCVAGHFDSDQGRHWIQQYFGPLRRGEPAPPLEPCEPVLAHPERITLFDRVSQAYAELVWPTVPADHPDEAALDVLASILGGSSRWNRLFRALMYDRQVASAASASHPTYRFAGMFQVHLTARTGLPLDDVVRLASAEIERLKSEGPTLDEVRRVKIERRRSLINQLDSVSSKANVLGFYAARLGNALAFRSVLTRVFAVTPAEVQRVARLYLTPERIELNIYPGERRLRPGADDFHRGKSARRAGFAGLPRDAVSDFSTMPEIGPTPRFIAPRLFRRQLANGLKLLIVERHELPHVRLALFVGSGETSVACEKTGLPMLMVHLLEEGTKSRGALQLESDLIDIGATLWTEGWLDSTTVNMTTVTRHLNRALDLYADVILNPSFLDQEFLRLKLARTESLMARRDNAAEIAEDVYPRLLYHRLHPYARNKLGTRSSVQSITREDVVAFYRQTYVPGNATLIVAGDVVPDGITAALEARFGGWPARPVPEPPDLRLISSPAGARTIYLIDKPGAAQSVLYIGRVGTSIRSRDRHALTILKTELGGRISSKLADEKAVTYGFSEKVEFWKGPSPILVTGSVYKFATATALADIFKEMNDFASERPITDLSVAQIQNAKLPYWIDTFETIADVVGQLTYMASRELPDRYISRELAAYQAVTTRHVNQVAAQYLAPWRMTVLVVGDRYWIEQSLSRLPFVKSIRVLDVEGNPIIAPAPPRQASPAIAGASLSETSTRARPAGK